MLQQAKCDSSQEVPIANRQFQTANANANHSYSVGGSTNLPASNNVNGMREGSRPAPMQIFALVGAAFFASTGNRGGKSVVVARDLCVPAATFQPANSIEIGEAKRSGRKRTPVDQCAKPRFCLLRRISPDANDRVLRERHRRIVLFIIWRNPPGDARREYGCNPNIHFHRPAFSVCSGAGVCRHHGWAQRLTAADNHADVF